VDQVAELGSSLVPYVLQTTFNAVFVIGTMFFLDFRLTIALLSAYASFFSFSGSTSKTDCGRHPTARSSIQ